MRLDDFLFWIFLWSFFFVGFIFCFKYFLGFYFVRTRSQSMPIEVDFDRTRLRSNSTWFDFDFGHARSRYITICRLSYKSMVRLCFSESARKMMQNGGIIVANGWIFVLIIDFFIFDRMTGRESQYKLPC